MPPKPTVEIDKIGIKPSKLYERLKCIHKGQLPDSKIKAIWIQQLPLELQLVMAAVRNQNGDKLVIVADKMMDIYEAQIKKPKIHELLLKQRIEALSDKIEGLNKALKKLSNEDKNAILDTEDFSEIRRNMDSVHVKGAEKKSTYTARKR